MFDYTIFSHIIISFKYPNYFILLNTICPGRIVSKQINRFWVIVQI